MSEDIFCNFHNLFTPKFFLKMDDYAVFAWMMVTCHWYQLCDYASDLIEPRVWFPYVSTTFQNGLSSAGSAKNGLKWWFFEQFPLFRFPIQHFASDAEDRIRTYWSYVSSICWFNVNFHREWNIETFCGLRPHNQLLIAIGTQIEPCCFNHWATRSTSLRDLLAFLCTNL